MDTNLQDGEQLKLFFKKTKAASFLDPGRREKAPGGFNVHSMTEDWHRGDLGSTPPSALETC